MKTITKAKKPASRARKFPVKAGSTAVSFPYGIKPRPLPAPRATAEDLLRDLGDGTWDAAAAKCDWSIVERAVKNRRRSSVLRAAS